MNLSIINQLAGNIGWKDGDHRYLGCNNQLAISLKLDTPDDIIGLRDQDLPFHSEEDKQFYQQTDLLALSGEVSQHIHVFNNNHYFVTKGPLKDHRQRITGVIFQCQLLTTMRHFISTPQHNATYLLTKQLTSHRYQVQAKHNPLQLTKREQECLFHLLRSHTSKQIAEILMLSKRTVDFYIGNIKNKMGCRTKAELLLKAVDMGYLHQV